MRSASAEQLLTALRTPKMMKPLPLCLQTVHKTKQHIQSHQPVQQRDAASGREIHVFGSQRLAQQDAFRKLRQATYKDHHRRQGGRADPASDHGQALVPLPAELQMHGPDGHAHVGAPLDEEGLAIFAELNSLTGAMEPLAMPDVDMYGPDHEPEDDAMVANLFCMSVQLPIVFNPFSNLIG